MTNIDPPKRPSAKLRGASPDTKPTAAPSVKAAPSKSDIVAKLLARPKGATVAEVSSATGWQPHSVRAFLSGLRKKGVELMRGSRKDGTTYYRRMPPAGTELAPTTASLSASHVASTDSPDTDA